MFSFDTPLSPDGLYVNLTSFHGVGKDFLAMDHQRTAAALYVHQKWTKVGYCKLKPIETRVES